MAVFNHPGNQLKALGKTIFIMSGLLLAVLGYLIGERASGLSEENSDLPILGLIVGGAIGFIVGGLIAIIIIAFGELVENSTIIREHIETGKVPILPKDIIPNTVIPSSNTDSKDMAISAIAGIICNKCGTPCEDGSNYCERCGNKLE